MCRKLAYLCSVVLALGVVLTSVARAELLAHWTFDEGSGTMIQDSSGNGYNGLISGTPLWTVGPFDGALTFNNTIGAEVPSFDPTGGTGSFSIAFWSNWDGVGGIQHFFTKSNGWNISTMMFQVECKGLGNSDPARDRRLHLACQSFTQAVLHEIPTGEWAHNTLVYDGAAGTATGYLNGVDEIGPQPTGIGEPLDCPVLIGVAQPLNRVFQGSLDDMWLFSHVLSPAEIQQVMMGGLAPGLASSPNPADEATDVSRDAQLNWTPGEFAPTDNGHIVYFSESFGDVNDGVGGIRQSASSYDPGRLEFGTMYYWRVDEVNAPPDSTVHQGAVWSFTTEPVGYPVDGASITATASSTGQAEFGPEKTIDGSGLDENDLHSTNATAMWLSGDEPQGAWIQYEFDKMQKLHQMWVWNSNQVLEGVFGFGMKDVSVEYSTDGAAWTAVADVPEFARAPGAEGYAHDTTVDFGGAVARFVRLTATSNWAGLLAQYGLSEIRFFSVPVSAREPSPDSGAADVVPDVSLSWRAGREAATHDVYLSTDEQAVVDGAAPPVSVTDTSYSATLNLGSTYYWRVDEVNDAETPTTWQGDIWSLSTLEYLVVDGFEDYNDYPSYEIYSTWLDGYESPTNGSQVGYLTPPAVETTIIHGGAQSMPLLYNNTGTATYSEAASTFAVGQDWTKYGIRTLGLWFHGAAGNTGQLYVKINGVKVPYDDDASNLAIPLWQPWNIDLTATGANLTSVTTLAIGIDGNGAAGTLYFDDIRLYAYARQLVTPVEPDPANLVGHWPFDEGLGNTAVDSSGNGHDGTLLGQSSWSSPGWDGTGSAVNFIGTSADDPTNGRVAVDPFDVHGTGITIAAWIRPLDHFNNDGRIVSKTLTGSTSDAWWSMLLGGSSGEDNLQTRIRTDIGVATAYTADDTYDVALDEWTHVAALWDSSDQTVWLYENGEQILSAAHPGAAMATDPALGIGIGNRSPTLAPPGNYQRTFHGIIDDVRIYDQGLPQEQIRWLAGRTQPFDKPF